jgi:hypothetical protein
MRQNPEVKNNNTLVLDAHLQGYRQRLMTDLDSSDDYEGFIELIARELGTYGINSWTYTPLDLPDILTVEEHLGRMGSEVVQEYMGEKLYKHDMILQHVKMSDIHLYQSDVEIEIEKSLVIDRNRFCQKRIIEINKKHGHSDICNIPMTSHIDGSRYLFCINSKGFDPSRFKHFTLKKMPFLKTIAISINDIGVRNYPHIFLAPVRDYKAIAYSQPLVLLAAMVEKDLSIAEGSAHLGLSPNTGHNHLKRLRDKLGVKTNHTAYKIAKAKGYI